MDTRKTTSLHPHEENLRIYRDGPTDDLLRSVAEKGVLQAILITFDDRIISGHCRWLAASEAGLTEVPVSVFGSRDELDIVEALVHTNYHRPKTKEQLAREAQTLTRVQKERAARRMREAAARGGESSGATRRGEVKGVVNSPHPSDAGKSRDKVAADLGVSGQTVDRLVHVADAIDAHEAAGEADKAEHLRETLNTRSVHAAYKETLPVEDVCGDEAFAAPDTEQPSRPCGPHFLLDLRSRYNSIAADATLLDMDELDQLLSYAESHLRMIELVLSNRRAGL